MSELEKKYESIMWMITSYVRNEHISEDDGEELKAEISEFYKIATQK